MSDSQSLVANTDFKAVMRERILQSFMDLIPKDKIDELVDGEIKAFFETPQLLTVQQTTVEVANPNYDPSRSYSSYGNEKTIKREAIAFGSHMTPFRQLVWTCLYEHLRPQLEATLSDANNTARKELDAWFAETAQPDVTQAHKALFTQLALGMSVAMLQSAMQQAMATSHVNMMNALGSVGVNTSALPQPFLTPVRV